MPSDNKINFGKIKSWVDERLKEEKDAELSGQDCEDRVFEAIWRKIDNYLLEQAKKNDNLAEAEELLKLCPAMSGFFHKAPDEIKKIIIQMSVSALPKKEA